MTAFFLFIFLEKSSKFSIKTKVSQDLGLGSPGCALSRFGTSVRSQDRGPEQPRGHSHHFGTLALDPNLNSDMIALILFPLFQNLPQLGDTFNFLYQKKGRKNEGQPSAVCSI